MELEMLNAMNQNLQQSLLAMVEIILIADVLLVLIGFAVYLVGLVQVFFGEATD